LTQFNWQKTRTVTIEAETRILRFSRDKQCKNYQKKSRSDKRGWLYHRRLNTPLDLSELRDKNVPRLSLYHRLYFERRTVNDAKMQSRFCPYNSTAKCSTVGLVSLLARCICRLKSQRSRRKKPKSFSSCESAAYDPSDLFQV